MGKPFRTTVTGSYPRPVQPQDTLRKPELSREEADEIIRWAVRDQVDTGLDIVTDGEGRRENMYYFVQKRVDGVSFEEMTYRKFGTAGFGIELAQVVAPLTNPNVGLAHDWRVARDAAPADVEVKLTCIGPHMLAKFSDNRRPDLYPDDAALAAGYARILNQEFREAVRAGCEFIQFDEPAWTAFPEDAVWAAETLKLATAGLGIRFGLHVCGGNAYRKRVYFARYTDMVEAFRAAPVDQISLEHCTLEYDMMPLWEELDYRGEFAVGVLDQRSDEIEHPDLIVERTRPALEHFPPERLLLTSECGFQHVPLNVTRKKLRTLVAGAEQARRVLVRRSG